MTARYTIGIEEEFQIVDRNTGQLSPQIIPLLKKGAPFFGEQIKPEMLQPTVELISTIYPNILVARSETQRLRAKLSSLLAEEGLALISAGTNPGAIWMDQLVTPNPRYHELLEEFQDVARSILIFGLHIHVAVENNEVAISLMNQLRTWLPHLLALSSNSPFWAGRLTGLKSYRTVVWKRFPRSGLPDTFQSWSEYEHYVQTLISTGCIDNGKKIWWDIRPHPFFGTVEFRIFDMPSTLNDVMGIAALCQSLVAKLSWLHKQGKEVPIVPRNLLEENKWRAMRYGLDAEVVDFGRGRSLSMRASIHELLDMVDDVADDLGTCSDLSYIRNLVDDTRGTGADRQIAIYQQTGSIHAVYQYLMQQTLAGIQLDSLDRKITT
ncbi:MAG TPA: carboxylate-amine ligase [Ktedonobacter sp.]|nr:carboxylate-amine ligase [Ktedonobacter sp.]HBE24441.1 carboxylate-amine ligase [Ktedonobacter sp.]HCJ34724.1 carboxylate-amine ligase [Ktedonobacter sp.]